MDISSRLATSRIVVDMCYNTQNVLDIIAHFTHAFSNADEGHPMINISRTIKIQAPIDKVFDCLGGPKTLPGVWFDLVELRNIGPNTRLGIPHDPPSTTPGLPSEGKSNWSDQSLYGQFVARSQYGLNSTITWAFYVEGGATRVTLRMRYALPYSLLRTGKEQLLMQENERDVDALLENIKRRVERKMAPDG